MRNLSLNKGGNRNSAIFIGKYPQFWKLIRLMNSRRVCLGVDKEIKPPVISPEINIKILKPIKNNKEGFEWGIKLWVILVNMRKGMVKFMTKKVRKVKVFSLRVFFL